MGETCNLCGAELVNGAVFCDICGAKINIFENESIPVASEAKTESELAESSWDDENNESVNNTDSMEYCKFCGKQIYKDSIECPECGAMIKDFVRNKDIDSKTYVTEVSENEGSSVKLVNEENTESVEFEYIEKYNHGLLIKKSDKKNYYCPTCHAHISPILDECPRCYKKLMVNSANENAGHAEIIENKNTTSLKILKCRHCSGTGRVKKYNAETNSYEKTEEWCLFCHGKGIITKKKRRVWIPILVVSLVLNVVAGIWISFLFDEINILRFQLNYLQIK